MKRKELMIIGGVAVLAAIIAFFISDAVFGSPKKHPIKVPVVTKISSDFPNPQNDTNYQKFFNSQAINPTKIIKIGDSNNTSPFQTGTQ